MLEWAARQERIPPAATTMAANSITSVPARDPVAATGMGLLAGTWGRGALTDVGARRDQRRSRVFLLTAGLAVQVPDTAAPRQALTGMR